MKWIHVFFGVLLVGSIVACTMVTINDPETVGIEVNKEISIESKKGLLNK